MSLAPPPPADLWAITSYFNPFGFRARRENYRRFRQGLTLPLVAIELGFRSRFELEESDATRLVRVPGEDVMWHKERLLNLALAELPSSCTKVVWIDSDVLFEREDWPTSTSRALDEVPLLQPFSRARELTQSGAGALARSRDSFARRLADDEGAMMAQRATPLARLEERFHDYTPGLAWAARRELLDATGFYDAMIVGGGDAAMARAAVGQHLYFTDYVPLAVAHRRHYLAWAERFHREVGGRVGVLPGAAYALWHGSVGNRRYRSRHEVLRRHDFDPERDLALDDRGAWRWASEKVELHREVSEYLASRLEDGMPGEEVSAGADALLPRAEGF